VSPLSNHRIGVVEKQGDGQVRKPIVTTSVGKKKNKVKKEEGKTLWGGIKGENSFLGKKKKNSKCDSELCIYPLKTATQKTYACKTHHENVRFGL